MAFMSVVLVLLMFFLLMAGIFCLFACAVFGLVLCMVFAFQYRKEKKNGTSFSKGEWEKKILNLFSKHFKAVCEPGNSS